MKLFTTNNEFNYYEDLSSQTTSSWPFMGSDEGTNLLNLQANYDVNFPTIFTSLESPWEESMEKVLIEYADAWRRLAIL